MYCDNYILWSECVTRRVPKHPPTASFIIRLMSSLMESELRNRGHA